MKDYTQDFGPFDGHVWINCSHQGALPKTAGEALEEAKNWKVNPIHMTSENFTKTIENLRNNLSKLISASQEEIYLANSSSYGIHLAANGITFEKGDEIILMKGDFPSNIFPWLDIEKKGVKIRFIEPAQYVVSPDEFNNAITSKTRLFCVSLVHSFSGYKIDIDSIGKICRDNDIIFVVNASQAIGVLPINIKETKIDILSSVGFKWLCGPYGTGFCWMRPEIIDKISYNKNYWLTMMTADDLGSIQDPRSITHKNNKGKYDIFGTANFFNYKPWTASIEYLLNIGIEKVSSHNYFLVKLFIEGLDRKKYQVASPTQNGKLTNIIFISHIEPGKNENIYSILKLNKIHIAFRNGKLRISPHIYNTEKDIKNALALKVLNNYK